MFGDKSMYISIGLWGRATQVYIWRSTVRWDVEGFLGERPADADATLTD
jgi:hypothetical protein